MKIRVLGVAAAVVLFSAPAFALHCPADIANIDKTLAAGADLSVDEYVEVMDLRFQGEAQHKAGQHEEAVATLAKALDILKAERGQPPTYY